MDAAAADPGRDAAAGGEGGGAPSTAIAVNGPVGPAGAIPDSSSVARTVSRTGPLLQPAGAPQDSRGRVASDLKTTLVTGEVTPEPETATMRA